MDVPTGWVQVFRGPRLPSQKVAHGTTRAASASATGQPSVIMCSRPICTSGSTRESGRKPRSSPFKGREVECLKAELEEGEEGGSETSPRHRGRCVSNVDRKVRDANCGVGQRARIGAISFGAGKGTSSLIGIRADSSCGKNPLPLIGELRWINAGGTRPGSSRPCCEAAGCGAYSIPEQWRHPANAHFGPSGVGQ